jgi:hypothetical protein
MGFDDETGRQTGYQGLGADKKPTEVRRIVPD